MATLLPGEYVNDSILDAFIKHVWSRPETSALQVPQHGSYLRATYLYQQLVLVVLATGISPALAHSHAHTHARTQARALNPSVVECRLLSRLAAMRALVATECRHCASLMTANTYPRLAAMRALVATECRQAGFRACGNRGSAPCGHQPQGFRV